MRTKKVKPRNESRKKMRPYTRVCTDKRRVLLMSEDGKWHCYDRESLGH